VEYVSVKNFKTPLGLADTPETANPELYAEMAKVYNALKALGLALDTYTGSPIFTVEATEALVYADLVDLYDVAGVLKARKANATDHTKPCKAFCSEAGGIAIGASGNITLRGFISIAGVTPGLLYYTSTTAGGILNGKPGGAGNLQQCIGYGLDTTTIYFNPEFSGV